jgi:hypothetical protein
MSRRNIDRSWSKKTKLRGMSSRANYTARATAVVHGQVFKIVSFTQIPINQYLNICVNI